MKDIPTYAINFNRTQYEDIALNFSNIGNVEARYIETTNLKHRGHRLIAALPPIFMNMQIAAIETGTDTARGCTAEWIRNVSKTTYSLSRDKLNILAKYGNKTDKKLPADLRDYRPIMTDETNKRPICEIAQINDAIKADSCKKHIDNMKSNVINNVGSFIGNTYSYRELCKVFDELNREFNLLELGEKKKDRKKKVALSEFNSFNGISNKSKKGVGTILAPRNIWLAAKKLRISIEDYIEKHSVLPFFRIFLDKSGFEYIQNVSLYRSRGYTKRLFVAKEKEDSIAGNSLWYCPACHIGNKNYNSIKSAHQIPGVLVCREHNCYLKSISIASRKDITEPKTWDIRVQTCEDPWLLGIAEDIEFIMNTCPKLDVSMINKSIEVCLIKLIEAYSASEVQHGILKEYEKLPFEYQVYYKKFSLQRFLVREGKDHISSTEYLVLIRYLFGSFETFYSAIKNDREQPKERHCIYGL